MRRDNSEQSDHGGAPACRPAFSAGPGGGRRASRRGFTLIEVLIAILVLALGLLGLGAVFPVALRAQRQSAEETLGVAASNSARAFLMGYDFRSAMTAWVPPSGYAQDNRSFWRDWRDDPTNGLNERSPNANSPSPGELGYWQVPEILLNSFSVARYGVPANTTLPQALRRPLSSQVFIPVRERLFPTGGTAEPVFVWDIAVHRTTDNNWATNATFDDIEVAVFVRRIDQRIRPADGHTLYQSFTGERLGGVAAADRRYPVGIHDSGPDIELPSGDGLGKYAKPLTADVRFDFNPPSDTIRTRLYVEPSASNAVWRMIRQPGQKLVDNLGQVHTVRGYGENGSDRFVDLEQPVKTPATAAGTLQQVVFTPQVPISVFVVRIKP